MDFLEKDNFSPDEISSLNEISAMGAKRAAVVLSKMIGKNIDVSFPAIGIANLYDAIGEHIPRQQLVSFVFSRFNGSINGTAALVFSSESTVTILHSLYKRNVSSLEFLEQIDYSILKETGNVLISSFLNALCNTFELTTLPTVPDVAVDFIEAILDSFSLVIYMDGREKLVSVRTELIATPDGNAIFGTLLLLFDSTEDLNAILHAKLRKQGKP